MHTYDINFHDVKQYLDKITDYLVHAEQTAPIEFKAPGDLAEAVHLALPEKPCSPHQLSHFIDQYLRYAVNTRHHGFMNQLWSKTLLSGFVGETLAAATNTSVYTYEAAPLASLLEQHIVRALTALVWSAPGDGIMTSGGTASNLQALLTARNNHDQHIKHEGMCRQRLAIFSSRDAHYSVKRAANVLGIGMEQVIEVEPDAGRTMGATALARAMDQAVKRGLTPFCVVATAGTTVYGAYDQIGAIADLLATMRADQRPWLHVDGALGASVLFSDQHKGLLQGIAKADSLAWDFHKMLGLHLPCAFLLVRKQQLLKEVISTANDRYLFHDDNQMDLGNKSMQCGRRVDVIKLWLAWLASGTQGFAKRVDDLFDLAQYAEEYVVQHPELVLVSPRVSVNICFRFKPYQKNLVIAVRDLLIQRGQYMLNYASDAAGPFFRLVLTNPDLSKEQLNTLLDTIVRTGQELAAEDCC